MNKTALNTLIKQLEHRIELAEKKKQEEDGLFGEMSYHFVMAGLKTAIEDAKQLLEMEKEQLKLAYHEDRPFLLGYETGEFFEEHYKENYEQGE
jgi:hypothetical protein